ncbi:MAG: maleylpyruvate isomerase N-terminal domain-containing protein [Microthrixaceae bacterium]
MEPNTGTHDVGEPGVGDRYRDARLRITALLEPVNDSAWDTPVDACTGWRVRDVLAHLVGVIEDAAAGRLGGPPDPVQTAAEVDRHRDDDPRELLRTWSAIAAVRIRHHRRIDVARPHRRGVPRTRPPHGPRLARPP